jgi:hypothetical protein
MAPVLDPPNALKTMRRIETSLGGGRRRFPAKKIILAELSVLFSQA